MEVVSWDHSDIDASGFELSDRDIYAGSQLVVKAEPSNEDEILLEDFSVLLTLEVVVVCLKLFPLFSINVLVSIDNSSETFLGKVVNYLIF